MPSLVSVYWCVVNVARTNWDPVEGMTSRSPRFSSYANGTATQRSSGNVHNSGANERSVCQSVSKAGSLSERQARAMATRSRRMVPVVVKFSDGGTDMYRHILRTTDRGREQMVGEAGMVASASMGLGNSSAWQ